VAPALAPPLCVRSRCFTHDGFGCITRVVNCERTPREILLLQYKKTKNEKRKTKNTSKTDKTPFARVGRHTIFCTIAFEE
jgi:hypothetical protein